MAKRKVKFQQGCYYHIYNRGARRRSIFLDDADYRHVLLALKEYSTKYCVAVIAYCLMPNHYHWVLRQDGPTAARYVPQYIFNGYVKAFNLRHGGSGTLFERPFEAIHVDTEAYLRNLCSYVHANPVRHGFAAAPELWPYSNYQEWIGQRAGTLVDHTFVRARFPNPVDYQNYVADHLTGRRPLPDTLRWYLDELEAD